jgi:cysteine desulfurase
MKKQVYLDYAAATPIRREVLEVMRPWVEDKFYNPSSLYAASREAKSALEDARHRIAQVIGAKKSEIIFTSGATESINLAILGTARSVKSVFTQGPLKVVASSIEHESVLACLKQLTAEGFDTELLPVNGQGLVPIDDLASAVDDQTILISIGYANSEIGTIQPISKIIQLINRMRALRQQRGISTPLYLHTDAAQAAGWLDLHVSRLGVDLMTLSASKVYGPKQTGALYLRHGVPTTPIIHGGGQEQGRRSGTESVAAAVGFALALELADQDRPAQSRRLQYLRDNLLSGLKSSIPELTVNGDIKQRLAGNLNVSIPGVPGETALFYLDQKGVQVSTGSACSTGRTDASHVLIAIGLTHDQANSSLRFTLGRQTTQSDIDLAITAVCATVSKVRKL